MPEFTFKILNDRLFLNVGLNIKNNSNKIITIFIFFSATILILLHLYLKVLLTIEWLDSTVNLFVITINKISMIHRSKMTWERFGISIKIWDENVLLNEGKMENNVPKDGLL